MTSWTDCSLVAPTDPLNYGAPTQQKGFSDADARCRLHLHRRRRGFLIVSNVTHTD